MKKEFLKIKQRAYFSQEFDKFIEKLKLLGVTCSSKKLEKEIISFLLRVKEPIYREVEREYLREDVMNKIKEWYGIKGQKLATAVPAWVIDAIIDSWQDQLGNAEPYWDTNWDTLNDVLSDESWLSCFKYYTRNQMLIYSCYLKDWYANHQLYEQPVNIREFFECEMQDEELSKYYLNLSNSKKKRQV